MQGWESVCWGGSPYFRLFNVGWLPSSLVSAILCYMITFLKNKKVYGDFYFMFFDINEIQIQVGALFNNEKCIIFNSSSSQNYFQDIYIYAKNHRKSKQKRTSSKQKTKTIGTYDIQISKIFEISDVPDWHK